MYSVTDPRLAFKTTRTDAWMGDETKYYSPVSCDSFSSFVCVLLARNAPAGTNTSTVGVVVFRDLEFPDFPSRLGSSKLLTFRTVGSLVSAFVCRSAQWPQHHPSGKGIPGTWGAKPFATQIRFLKQRTDRYCCTR